MGVSSCCCTPLSDVWRGTKHHRLYPIVRVCNVVLADHTDPGRCQVDYEVKEAARIETRNHVIADDTPSALAVGIDPIRRGDLDDVDGSLNEECHDGQLPRKRYECDGEQESDDFVPDELAAVLRAQETVAHGMQPNGGQGYDRGERDKDYRRPLVHETEERHADYRNRGRPGGG